MDQRIKRTAPGHYQVAGSPITIQRTPTRAWGVYLNGMYTTSFRRLAEAAEYAIDWASTRGR